jgi:hypothetical protein
VKREILRYEFVLQADEPICHAAENIGNETILARRKIRQPAGGWADVAIVSGDAMRHGMRSASAYALLDAAGLLETPALSEAALRLLFAGGMVTGRGDAGVINLDRYRELCELVPSMGLFGGCSDNRVIPGRLHVEDATLICEETRRFVPAWVSTFAAQHAGPLDTCRAHVEEVQRVRMDPTLVPTKRLLLSTDAQVEANKRLAASEAAHASDDAIERADAKSSMMPRRFERIAQGSLFFWACEAECYSDLDVDTFHVSAAAFLSAARVGGKQGTGHGKLVPVAGNAVAIARPSESLRPINAAALAPQVGELFRAHVRERANRIRSFFQGVNA